MDIGLLETYIKTLKKFFNEIEYYDLDEKIKIFADKNDRITISNIENSKENALILNNALKEKKRLVEVDYVDEKIYETISNYYDGNGRNCVLKLRIDINDNVIVNAIAMLDVDDFKKVNDKYGHQKGDEVLAVIAQTIEKSVEKSGTVVRYGGDEFVVVFHEIEKKKFASQLAKVCKAVNSIKIEGMKEKLSVSVGGVYGYENLKDMIGKADKLMYQAKKSKNDYAYADSDKI